MKRLFVFLALAALIVGFILVVGCSDDDESTTPVVKETGDPNAPEFEAARDAFGFADEMNGIMFGFLFITIDSVLASPDFPAFAKPGSINSGGAFASDSFALAYHDGSKYWYAMFLSVDTIDGDTLPIYLTFLIQDSLQFLQGTTPVQWPDSALVSGVKHGISIAITSSDLTEAFVAHQFLSVNGDLPGNGDVEINGNSSFLADFTTGPVEPYCDFSIDLSSNYQNVNANLSALEGDGCPTSGTARYSGGVNMSCYGDTTFTFNDSWSVVQTFSQSNIHYVFENSTTRWEFDDPCGSAKTRAGQFDFLLDRLR
jgi:hypothetical protein